MIITTATTAATTTEQAAFRSALIAAFAKAAEIGAISKDGKRKKVAAGKWEWIKKVKAPKAVEAGAGGAAAAKKSPAKPADKKAPVKKKTSADTQDLAVPLTPREQQFEANFKRQYPQTELTAEHRKMFSRLSNYEKIFGDEMARLNRVYSRGNPPLGVHLDRLAGNIALTKSGLTEEGLVTVRSWSGQKATSAPQSDFLPEFRHPVGHFGSKAQPFWRPGPNPTVDNVITRDNPKTGAREVLLIQRATTNKHGEPVAEGGKWALPGGFHDSDAKKGEAWRPGKETAEQAAMRELAEETGLDANSLKSNMKHVGQFGDPKKPTGRDPRDNKEAWSVSNAFHLHLTPELATKAVAGTDDASDAKWVPLSEVGKMPLAFDHAKILNQAKVEGKSPQSAVPNPQPKQAQPVAPKSSAIYTPTGEKKPPITVAAGLKMMRNAGLNETQIRILESKAGQFATDKKGRPLPNKRQFDPDELATAIRNIKSDAEHMAKKPSQPKKRNGFGARLVAAFRSVRQ